MTPKNTTSRLQKGYCILFLVLPFFAMAQDSFNDDTKDTQAAPIDDYIVIALAIGIYYAYRFFKTQYTLKTKD
jgi:amino acid permease